MRFVFGILCFFASLYSEEIEENLLSLSSPYQLVNDHLIGGKVSPLSGQLSLRVTDLIVKGAQPIYLDRVYVPPYMPCFDLNEEQERGSLYNHLALNYRGWELLPHLKLQVIPHTQQVRLTDPGGVTLEFTLIEGKTTIAGPHFAMSNNMRNVPHGSYDSRNTRIEIAGELVTVYSPDGTTRYFRANTGREKIDPRHLKLRPYTCLLEKEILPNGKVLKYHYINRSLSRIESLDPLQRHVYSSIQIEGSTYTTSSGLTAHYNYEIEHTKIKKTTFTTPPILKSVSSPFYKNEEMGYCSCLLLNTYKGKEENFHSLHRPCEIPNANYPHYRIHTLKLPLGPHDEMESVYEISYQPPLAGINEGSTTAINNNGTKTIYYYNSNLLPKVFAYFDEGGTLKKEKHFSWYENNWLKAIEIHDGISHEVLYKKSYEYDSFGNPIKETFHGDEPYSIFREYSQDGRNLLLREEFEGGKITTYEYLAHTNLLTKKKTLDKCELYTYDDCHNLIRKVVTDGQNTKIITNYILRTAQPFLHMPEWVEEKYGVEEKLLKRTHLLYDTYGNVAQEEVYDAEGNFAYTLYKEYNKRGDLLSETNPLGQKAFYTYDDRGLCTSSTNFSQRLLTTFSYDAKGRLLKEVKGPHISSFTYDANDRLLQKTDYLNNTTKFTYDLLVDKVIKTDFPGSITTSSHYDALGRKITDTDANGNTTTTRYNAYGSPIELNYPDESKEVFTYFKNGRLASHTDKDGLTNTYTYDLMGRVILKKSAFAEESFTYDSFNLTSKTDQLGNITKYFYDGLCRKVREETQGRVTEFSYDALGELSTICKNKTLLIKYKRDIAGQILEETKTDMDGNLLNKISYTYDPDGNQNTLTRYIDGNEGVESWQYDLFGRVVEHKDALGCITKKVYDESGPLKIITINPKSIATIETFDSFNHLIEKQIGEKSYKNFSYDPQGNLISERQGNQVIDYAYTNSNRIASLTRQGLRTTSFTYTPSGKLSTKTLSDGTTLAYKYHPLGFLKSLKSSDGKIHHTFQYDKMGHLLEAADVVQNLTIQRKLDNFGNILEEIFPSGQKVEKTYDNFDRPLSLNGVFYTYDPLNLRKIQWDNYSHSYDQYDLDGNLLKETTLTGDPIIHTLNLRGQKCSITHPNFTQKCSYDATGNLIQCNEHFYNYDDLSQLTSEDSTQYTYDALSNRISKNDQTTLFNDLDEIISPDYSYDLNGNLTSKGLWHFSYDPLNRLVEAHDGNQKIHFTYDPLGRRLSKNKETYLYDGQNEIGAQGKNSRILGLYDETIAIFVHGKTYSSITDVQRNIRHLAKTPISYNFTAFGEELNPSKFSNPWRFASKRFDPELGLVYFGKRYYDPQSGRWISTDPAGFIDSTNLYQYVFNNPFRYTDPDGQFAFVIPLLVWGAEAVIPALTAYIAPIIWGTITGAVAYGGYKAVEAYNEKSDNYSAAEDNANYAMRLNAQVEEDVEIKGKKRRSQDVYAPDRPLPKDERTDEPVPETDGAHTQLGTRDGRKGKYKQAREFDANGKPLHDIDFTDHGRPGEHPNPHQHKRKDNETGGTSKRSKEAEILPHWRY